MRHSKINGHLCKIAGGVSPSCYWLKHTLGKHCLGHFFEAGNVGTGHIVPCHTVFGSGMTGKLFAVIREKMSLCYDIGSTYHGSKGIVTVGAGIDFDKEEQVVQEVLHQLQLCRDGHISDAELTSAKQAIISQLKATHDSPGAIENYYGTVALSGLGLSPAQYIAAVEQVSREQVAAAAQTLELHTRYFLKGVQ